MNKIYNFYFSHGGYPGPITTYIIEKQREKFFYTYQKTNCSPKINRSSELTVESIDNLSQILEENKIKNWDGFNQKNENILDGSSFELKIEYDNGDKITSSGHMIFPENYNNIKELLDNFFEKI